MKRTVCGLFELVALNVAMRLRPMAIERLTHDPQPTPQCAVVLEKLDFDLAERAAARCSTADRRMVRVLRLDSFVVGDKIQENVLGYSGQVRGQRGAFPRHCKGTRRVRVVSRRRPAVYAA